MSKRIEIKVNEVSRLSIIPETPLSREIKIVIDSYNKEISMYIGGVEVLGELPYDYNDLNKIIIKGEE